MTEQSKHINYSLADIERYFSGSMPVEEMHALEKTALQDAFLADALDGYVNANFNSAKQDLRAIEKALLPEKEQTKIVPLTRNKFSSWKVAASVIAIAVVGTISYKFINLKGKEQSQIVAFPSKAKDSALIALNKKEDIQKDTLSTLIVTTNKPVHKKERKLSQDATRIPFNSLAATNKNSSLSDSVHLQDLVVVGYGVARKKDISGAIPQIETDSIKQQHASGMAMPGRVAGIEVNESKKYKIAGTVTTEKGIPIPYASILIPDKHIGITTDHDGNFALFMKDSIAKVQISSIGYETATASVSSKNNNPIQLKENEQSLAETVMIGYGQRKEKKAIVGADEMKRNLMKDTLMPDGGWMNYTHYIKTRISLDTAESSFNNTEIEFEFDINKQGKAKNIDILKSPSEQINQQLIDAIEKGPKWIDNSVNKKSKKKAKIKL